MTLLFQLGPWAFVFWTGIACLVLWLAWFFWPLLHRWRS